MKPLFTWSCRRWWKHSCPHCGRISKRSGRRWYRLLLQIIIRIIIIIIIAEIKGIRNNSEWYRSLSPGPGRGIIEIWYSIIQEEWGCGYADDDASNGNYPKYGNMWNMNWANCTRCNLHLVAHMKHIELMTYMNIQLYKYIWISNTFVRIIKLYLFAPPVPLSLETPWAFSVQTWAS